MTRSLFTRVLHLAVAAAIVEQLVTSMIMRMPRPNRLPPTGIEAAAYSLHATAGVVALGVLMAFWIWTLVRRGERRPSVLFPWFSRARIRDVVDDTQVYLQAALKLRLPEPDDRSAFAGAVHGLGLALGLLMAATGTYIYYTWVPGHPFAGLTGTVLHIHKLFANLMWAYLIGHASMAVLHQWLKHPVLSDMFSFGTR